MKQYIVQMTDEARQDMLGIYRYIATELQAPETALGQYNHIMAEIVTLDFMPERCPIVEFEPERSLGLRRMLVDNYSVFYLVKDTQVLVVSVLYSSSDLERRLAQNLNN